MYSAYRKGECFNDKCVLRATEKLRRSHPFRRLTVPLFRNVGLLFGEAAKIKIVSRPNTRLVISYLATFYLNATESIRRSQK